MQNQRRDRPGNMRKNMSRPRFPASLPSAFASSWPHPLTILYYLCVSLLDNSVTLSSQYKLSSGDVALFCRFEQLAES